MDLDGLFQTVLYVKWNNSYWLICAYPVFWAGGNSKPLVTNGPPDLQEK